MIFSSILIILLLIISIYYLSRFSNSNYIWHSKNKRRLDNYCKGLANKYRGFSNSQLVNFYNKSIYYSRGKFKDSYKELESDYNVRPSLRDPYKKEYLSFCQNYGFEPLKLGENYNLSEKSQVDIKYLEKHFQRNNIRYKSDSSVLKRYDNSNHSVTWCLYSEHLRYYFYNKFKGINQFVIIISFIIGLLLMVLSTGSVIAETIIKINNHSYNWYWGIFVATAIISEIISYNIAFLFGEKLKYEPIIAFMYLVPTGYISALATTSFFAEFWEEFLGLWREDGIIAGILSGGFMLIVGIVLLVLVLAIGIAVTQFLPAFIQSKTNELVGGIIGIVVTLLAAWLFFGYISPDCLSYLLPVFK